MTAEQITTIITNLLTGGGIVFFVGMVIRGLKSRIEEMNKTIEVQQQTLKAMETRVLETEKIGNIYRQLFETLPTEVEKWKTAILKLKDERIEELEKANQDRDEKHTNTVKIEIEKLELQQRALEDVPRLREELIGIVGTLQQRLSTVEQLAPFKDPALKDWVDKGSSLETMLKNERDIYSLMSAYTEEDRKIALAVWRFLEADSKPTTAKTIASKLNLAIYAVHTAIDRLIDRGCVEIVDSASGRATYAAILPKQ